MMMVQVQEVRALMVVLLFRGALIQPLLLQICTYIPKLAAQEGIIVLLLECQVLILALQWVILAEI